MECLHIETIKLPQTFKNGITHVRMECVDCGRFIKYIPQNVETFKLYFGKHKGKILKEVPLSYINWYIENGSDKKVVRRMRLFLELV